MSSRWSALRLEGLIGTSAVVDFAVESGLLAALLEGGGTCDELAEQLDLSAHPVELVLGVLLELGLATRDVNARYGARSDVQEAATGGPMPAGAQALLWQQLPSFARTGQTFLRKQDTEARDAVYQHVVLGLARRFQPSANELAAELPTAGGEILDVGAGSGVWSLSMAERDAATRVTGLDGPDTVEVFRAEAQRRGLGDRIETLAGDYHQLELDAGRYRRIVLGNVLHLESADKARSLVSRTAPALAPNGEFVIVDAVRDGAPEHRLMTSLYALHLGMRVAGSAVYRKADFESWVEGAGLTRHRWVPLESGLHALVATAA